jgi:hypothetical protein
VASLHDVQRYTVDVDPRTSGHGGSLAENEPGPSDYVPNWIRMATGEPFWKLHPVKG